MEAMADLGDAETAGRLEKIARTRTGGSKIRRPSRSGSAILPKGVRLDVKDPGTLVYFKMNHRIRFPFPQWGSDNAIDLSGRQMAGFLELKKLEVQVGREGGIHI